MNRPLTDLLAQNRAWATARTDADPEFFTRLSTQQSPEYLWIGCADSRVPANEITGLDPGEVFVHRNIANVVGHADLNCLSALQFSVEVLKVKHVLVVGHYGCGGVNAALKGLRLGLVDNWLRHVQDVRDKYQGQLITIDDMPERANRLCELNVIEQVRNVCDTTILRDAWHRGQDVTVHGWIYGLSNGILKDLNTSIARENDANDIYVSAVERLFR